VQNTKLTRYATTYSKASFREQIVSPFFLAIVPDAVDRNDTRGDDKLASLSSIKGFTRFPTPKALNRALFLRPGDTGLATSLSDLVDPIVCHDGDRFIDVHDQSIVAWELPLPPGTNPSDSDADTFYDAVRPLVDAF